MAGQPSSGGVGGTKVVASVKEAGAGIAKILSDLKQIDSMLDKISRKAGGIATSTGGAVGAHAWGAPGMSHLGGAATPTGANAWSIPGLSMGGGSRSGRSSNGMPITPVGAYAGSIPGLGGNASLFGPEAFNTMGMGNRYGWARTRWNNMGDGAKTLGLAMAAQGAAGVYRGQVGGVNQAVSDDLLYNQFATYGSGYSQNAQRSTIPHALTSYASGGFSSAQDRNSGYQIMRNQGMTMGEMRTYAPQASAFSRMTGSGFEGAAAIGATMNTAVNSNRLRMFGVQTRDPRTGNAAGITSVVDQMYARQTHGQHVTSANIAASFKPGGYSDVTFRQMGYDDGQIQDIEQLYMGKAKAGGAAISSAAFNKANPGLGKTAVASAMKRATTTQKIADNLQAGRISGYEAFNSAVGLFNQGVGAFTKVAGGPMGFMSGLIGGAGGGGGGVIGGLGHDLLLARMLGGKGAVFGEEGLLRGGGGLLARGASGAAGLGGGLLAAAPAIGAAIAEAFVSHMSSGTGKKLRQAGEKRGGVKGWLESTTGGTLEGVGSLLDISVIPRAAKHFFTGSKFAAGGVVPGSHDRDDVPIFATPGEVVVPKNIVKAHGGANHLMSRLGFRGKGGGHHYATGGEVVATAEQYLGTPYVYGGSNPTTGFDCSGLIQYSYGKAGIKIPRVSQDQQNYGSAVDPNNVQPGDLLFIGSPAHHVMMSIGGGKVIEAPHTGDVIKEIAYNAKSATNIRRIIGAGGGAGTSSASTAATVAAAPSSGLWAKHSGGRLWSKAWGGAGGAAGGAGGGAAPAAPGDIKGNVALAKKMAAARGWAGAEWDALYALWNQESGFRTDAGSPSHAYGIPQSLPGNKMASAGPDWMTNPATQIKWGMGYIAGRYSDPIGAWAHKHATDSRFGSGDKHAQPGGWYAKGAWRTKDEDAHLHEGEMVLGAAIATQVRSALATGSTIGGKGAAGGGHGGCGHPVTVQVYAAKADMNEARRLAEMVKGLLHHDEVMAHAVRG
jgi:hypothetical protein